MILVPRRLFLTTFLLLTPVVAASGAIVSAVYSAEYPVNLDQNGISPGIPEFSFTFQYDDSVNVFQDVSPTVGNITWNENGTGITLDLSNFAFDFNGGPAYNLSTQSMFFEADSFSADLPTVTALDSFSDDDSGYFRYSDDQSGFGLINMSSDGVTLVPEPSSITLLGGFFVVLGLRRRRDLRAN